MTFKPKQLDPKSIKVFSETEVGALVENIDSKLDLILETQNGIRNDVKDIGKDYKNLKERVDHTEIRLDVIEAR